MLRPLALTLLLASTLAGCSAAAGSAQGAAKDSVAASAAPSSPIAQVPQATQGKPDSLAIAADQGRISGSAASNIWLLEVSDFQCPWCKRWHDETYAAIRREYVDNGKIRLAYLNFPIPGHMNAWPAAIAAMCASTQGKFWPAHDRIFETQDKWKELPSPRAYFDSLAVAAGANAAKQTACSKSDQMRPLIEADQARARAAGVQSTPTFFIGDRKLEGAMPIDSFRKYINMALAGKK